MGVDRIGTDCSFNQMDAIERLKHSAFLVEATNNEVLHFWQEYHDSPNPKWHKGPPPITTWEQGSGFLVTLGSVDISSGDNPKTESYPICINLMWNKLNGYWVCFWEPTSKIVDYRMIEKYFNENFKRQTLDKRPATCNASNFQHCIHELESLKEDNEN